VLNELSAATLEAGNGRHHRHDQTARSGSGGERTARLHEVLCMAAEATATGALNTEGRLVLAAAVPRAALGTGWGVSYTGE
jgi:hypothetical protein